MKSVSLQILSSLFAAIVAVIVCLTSVSEATSGMTKQNHSADASTTHFRKVRIV